MNYLPLSTISSAELKKYRKKLSDSLLNIVHAEQKYAEEIELVDKEIIHAEELEQKKQGLFQSSKDENGFVDVNLGKPSDDKVDLKHFYN